MPDITKGKTFLSGQQLTAEDLNSMLDDAVINNNAITTAKLDDSACTTVKIPDDNVTYAKIQNVETANRVLGSTSADGVISEVQVATDMIEDNAVTAAKLAVGAALPTGSVTQYAGSSAPSGWLLANGDATLNTFTYKDLHAVISNTYGGTAYEAGVTDQDGVSTTFTLPDLRGRIPVGVGQQTSGKWDSSAEDYSGSGTNFALAATGGTEDHRLLQTELPKHKHRISNATAFGGSYAQGGTRDSAGPATEYTTEELFDSSNAAITEDQPHNNLQPYIALNYIIKT